MINLEHLTEEERKIIMDVLQRDEQLRQAEQERVKKLKTELHELRRKSAVKVDGDSAADSGKKVCARCREPLGTIFNSGELCPRCQHRVCSKCKVVLPSSKKWLCTVCNKQLQIKLESGDAFGPRREGQAQIYGSDLVKMSLAKSKPGLEPIVQVNGGPQSPADSGFHGRGATVPSVGENSTTFEDYPSEDYPSDVSYEQSMVSGVESIGPSVSERGSVIHPSGRGVATNHAHDDSTIVSNDVESGRYGSADITMERVPSQTGSPVGSQRGRQGRGTDSAIHYEKSPSKQSYSPVGSRKNFHGSAELSEDDRSYGSNGSGGRGSSRPPPIPTIAIQDAGDSYSDGEYHSGSERLYRQALEANMYRDEDEDHQTLEFSTKNHDYPELPNEEEPNEEEKEKKLKVGKKRVSFDVDQPSPEEYQDQMAEVYIIAEDNLSAGNHADEEIDGDVVYQNHAGVDGKEYASGERDMIENKALHETEEGLLLATASGVVQQVLIGAKQQVQEEMLGSGKGDAQKSPDLTSPALQPESSLKVSAGSSPGSTPVQTASGIVQQVLIGAERQMQEEMIGSGKGDAQKSPDVTSPTLQPESSLKLSAGSSPGSTPVQTASGIVQQVLIGAERQMQEEMIGSGKGDAQKSPDVTSPTLQPKSSLKLSAGSSPGSTPVQSHIPKLDVQDSAEDMMASVPPENSPAADVVGTVALNDSLEVAASASTSDSPEKLPPSPTIRIMSDLSGKGIIKELKLSPELRKDTTTGEWVRYRDGKLEPTLDTVITDHDVAKGTPNGHAARAQTKKEHGTVPVVEIHVEAPSEKPATPPSLVIDDDVRKEAEIPPKAPEPEEETVIPSLPEDHRSVARTDSLQRFTSRSTVSSASTPIEKRLSRKDMLHKGSTSSLTSLYSTGEEFYGKYPITGDVSFGLGYNFKTNVFEIKIGGCRDLVPIDAKKNKSDPYIKTYLLPDKSKNSKRKTKTKKGTINPNYSENLKYAIAQSELETRTLSVAVWHYDRFGHNMFLGEVLLPLDGVDLTTYPVKWHQLKTRVAPTETKPISYKGDIILALMFETLMDENKNGTSGSKSSFRRKKKGPTARQIGGSLKVHIKEAKNLTPPRVGAAVNPYVKVYLEPDRSKTGKKKTSTMRNTLNPSYEQSLEFPNVTQDILKERALEVGIWDSEIGSPSFLGGVRLGSGTGKSYGRSVDWQDSTGIEIQLWEEMLRNHNQWVEACLTLRASFDKDKKT